MPAHFLVEVRAAAYTTRMEGAQKRDRTERAVPDPSTPEEKSEGDREAPRAQSKDENDRHLWNWRLSRCARRFE